MNYNLITILGQTAVGKTKLAAQLVFNFDSELISADSRQVFVGMDIGTGKDKEDYIVGSNEVKYHMIDILSPTDEFNLFHFNKLFYQHFLQITAKNKIPFLVGGTGLYIHSILKGYDFPIVDESFDIRQNQLKLLEKNELLEILLKLKTTTHNITDIQDKERIIKAILVEEARNTKKLLPKENVNSLVIGINPGREIIKKRITTRLKERLKNGMIEEVENLIEKGLSYEKLDYFGLEYKYLGRYLQGKLSYNDMYQKLNSAIHDFAKRQLTFFRKMEKEAVEINWFESPDYLTIKNFISKNLND